MDIDIDEETTTTISGIKFTNKSAGGIYYRTHFIDTEFKRINLTGKFYNCKFSTCKFSNCNMSNTVFYNCIFLKCIFEEVFEIDSKFTNCYYEDEKNNSFLDKKKCTKNNISKRGIPDNCKYPAKKRQKTEEGYNEKDGKRKSKKKSKKNTKKKSKKHTRKRRRNYSKK